MHCQWTAIGISKHRSAVLTSEWFSECCYQAIWLNRVLLCCARICCRHVHNLLGLGSVSYYTMLRVPCPVVVVKNDNGD